MSRHDTCNRSPRYDHDGSHDVAWWSTSWIYKGDDMIELTEFGMPALPGKAQLAWLKNYGLDHAMNPNRKKRLVNHQDCRTIVSLSGKKFKRYHRTRNKFVRNVEYDVEALRIVRENKKLLCPYGIKLRSSNIRRKAEPEDESLRGFWTISESMIRFQHEADRTFWALQKSHLLKA